MRYLLLQALPRLVPAQILDPWPPSLNLFDRRSWAAFGQTASIYMERFQHLSKRYDFDWLDVYRSSEIGRERLAVAQTLKEFVDKPPPSGTHLFLEAGCGRGYFTTALSLTYPKARTIAADRMNGFGREGWWALCHQLWSATNVGERVRGVRTDLANLPFPEGIFDGCLCVHALRNMRHRDRRIHIAELARTTKLGGVVLLAEYTPVVHTEAQRLFLEVFFMKPGLRSASTHCPHNQSYAPT